MTIHRDEFGWYATLDFEWLTTQLAKDGLRIAPTGKTHLMADDELRTYFTVA